MSNELTSDLASAISFAAGGLIPGTLTIVAPEDGDYYVLIEQYTSALALIPGTREYLHQAVAGGTAVGSTTLTTIYELDEDEEQEVDINLTIAYTDCYLYLFLKRMAGAVPAPDTDDTVVFVVVSLSAASGEVPAELDMTSLMNLMITMMIVVMMMKMMTGAVKQVT